MASVMIAANGLEKLFEIQSLRGVYSRRRLPCAVMKLHFGSFAVRRLSGSYDFNQLTPMAGHPIPAKAD